MFKRFHSKSKSSSSSSKKQLSKEEASKGGGTEKELSNDESQFGAPTPLTTGTNSSRFANHSTGSSRHGSTSGGGGVTTPMSTRSTGSSGPRYGYQDDDSTIVVSSKTRREIINKVIVTVDDILHSMLGDSIGASAPSDAQVRWKPKMRKKNISYYVDDCVSHGQVRFCCVSYTQASVQDVMELFMMTDTASLLRNNRIIYNNVLEAKVLSVLRYPTKEKPMNSVYVRYTSFQTPGLMVNRDMCVAVATDLIHQPDGSTIGYCLWDSVEDEAFAEVASTPGLVPCPMFKSGFFLRNAGPAARHTYDDGNSKQGFTKIVYMVGMMPGGWAPNLQARILMERFGANLARLCSHFRRRHLDSSTFVLKSQWVSKSHAKMCHECRRPFQTLSKRVNCRCCGQVVCKTCSSKEIVELQAVGLVPMRICLTCLEDVGLISLKRTTQSQRNREVNQRQHHLDPHQLQYHERPRAPSGLSSSTTNEEPHEWDFTEEWTSTPPGENRVRHLSVD